MNNKGETKMAKMEWITDEEFKEGGYYFEERTAKMFNSNMKEINLSDVIIETHWDD